MSHLYILNSVFTERAAVLETAEPFYFVPGALFTSLISVLKDIL